MNKPQYRVLEFLAEKGVLGVDPDALLAAYNLGYGDGSKDGFKKGMEAIL